MGKIHKIAIQNFCTEQGKNYAEIVLHYQSFGKTLGSAPVVVVNHALTGNSQVIGEKGWWNELIGTNKTIDTNEFTVIAFNVPGNGYDGNPENLIENYKDFTARDIAQIFLEGTRQLKIEKLFTVIGGSLGGGIAWEMAALEPNYIENLIVIATDWKASDWIISNVLVQDQILNNSENPIHNARLHAMLLYRTPQSFRLKFKREINIETKQFEVESWLHHHGEKLKNRFQLSSYKLMNHLLKTIDITRGRGSFFDVTKEIKSNIHIIGIATDGFFTPDENRETYQALKANKMNVYYHEIDSIHGHDAFLIEYEQLSKGIQSIFNKQKQTSYVNA